MDVEPAVLGPAVEGAVAAPPAARGAGAGLDASLVRGIAWTGAVKWGTQVVTWASTLVVARVLTPEDYGLVGMATIFLGLVTLLSEFGIGAAIVSLRDLSDAQIRQLNAFSVLFGVASMGLTCLAAVPMSRFFDAPRLVGVMLAMSVTFLVSSFRTVPFSLLQKELRFRPLALVEGGQAIVLAMATLTLALLGFGYWTLVLGAILSSLLSTALVLSRYRHPFARPRFAALRGAMTFSGHILVSRFSWYVYSNADFFVVGRMLGQAALGVYGIAWTLASIPIEKVTSLVMRVTPAVFAAVQEDAAELRRYFLTLTEGIAVVTFPVTVGMALVAEDFVRLALGEKWAAAALPLQLLAVYASFRSLTPLLPQVLNVTGESALTMWNGMLAAVALPAAFLAGSRWGTEGVALAWIVAHPLVVLPLYRRVFRRIGLSPLRYLGALAPALTGTAVMATAVLLAGRSLPPGTPEAVGLGARIAAGALGYAAAVLGLHGGRVAAFRRVVAAARG